MLDIIKHLNNRILINDLIVKKMKYEVNMLFYDYPSKEQAKILAIKINNQIDSALIGLNDSDKEAVRRSLIQNSFLVIPNPVSDHMHYGHVFTTLTNFDPTVHETKKRLTRWLDLNTEVSYDENTLNQYITRYKIQKENPEQKTAAIEYQPTPKMSTSKKTYRLKAKVLWIPVAIAVIFVLSFTLNKTFQPQEILDNVPEKKQDVIVFIDKYYEEVTGDVNNPYHYEPLSFKNIYNFLKDKNSLLTDSDYISIINTHCESYNVNPLLLLAIIGQEQNFVPLDHEYANKIINNPYNVFGSWIEYNTSFEEATIICLNTIQTAKDTLPEDEDLVVWLNSTYAEDKNWSSGVKQIFTQLQSIN